jgi:hypothetical protein
MPETFDAYYKWLGIPPPEQPPNCYRLLGIALFESDPDVIATAADKQMAHIRSFQTGQHSALSQRILNEIAAARIRLLSPAKKVQYDEKLRSQLAELETRPQQVEPYDTSRIGIDSSATRAASVVKRSRQSHRTRLPWQLPAAIAVGLLASVAIMAYLLFTEPPQRDKPGAQAGADVQPPKVDRIAAADEKKPAEPLPRRPEVPTPKDEPRPEPEPPGSGARSEPKPEPQPGLEPKPAVEAPEAAAERLRDAFAKAKTSTEFRDVAVSSLKLVDEANAAGRRDAAKDMVALALSAARKAGDDSLAKMATLCFLEPGAKFAPADMALLDNRETSTADRGKPRQPIPGASAQEESVKIVNEVFKDKYALATTAERQKTVSHELLQKAVATTDDATAQYVLLKDAGRFAIQAKDADLVLQVTEEMGTRFDVDALDLKAKALMAMGKTTGPNEQFRAIVGSLLALMEEALEKEHYDLAKQLAAAAIDVARRSKEAALLKEAVARKGTIFKEVGEIQKVQAEVAEAIEFLGTHPTDPAANLAVGMYRCFEQNKWNKGMPMLALGNAPALKDLAAKELKGVAGAADQAKLGDDWWDFGEKKNGLAKENIEGHAAHWYQQALPGLTGLVKERVEKRLQETASIRASRADSGAGQAAAGPSRGLPYLADLKSQQAITNGDTTIPMSVGGKKLLHALWAHPPAPSSSSRFTFELPKGYRELDGAVALNDSARSAASALRFRIVGDGRLLWASRPVQQSGDVQTFQVRVSRVRILELFVDCPGSHASAMAIWVDPVLRK